MNLIIVESPTKARTFNRILKDKDYYVFATIGHIRDLPTNKLSIDYKNSFSPTYKIIKRKEETVAKLKELGEQSKEIILATDPDREGESIAYHAAYFLGFIKERWPDFKLVDKKARLKRIVFHEITEEALNDALRSPEQLRVNLVKAQQARRSLDRIVGYELSPLLWKKIGKYWLSAGRVQTVALRFVAEREKEIRSFEKEQYIQIYGLFSQDKNDIKAKLIKKDGIAYEQTVKLDLFAGKYTYTKTTINKNNLDEIQKDLREDVFLIKEIKETITTRVPPPPLTTSLLQQEAYNRFKYSSKATMRLAQDLYEAGLITYHRTDSFNLAVNFVFKAKSFIEKQYGKDYALENPRFYKTRSKLAQEAHEAMRPTKFIELFDSLNQDKKFTNRHKNLYELIFKRAVASQMREAKIKQIKISILGQKNYLFETNLQEVVFDGFLKLLNPEFINKNQRLVNLAENSSVQLNNLEIQENETKAPSRYNDASLIKALEERGIGRPSTYAPTLSLIEEKKYVEKQMGYFTPSILGEKISDYLSCAFPQIFDPGFTARMEDELDNIAAGNEDMIKLLTDFYGPFSKLLEEKKQDKEKISIVEKTEEKCPECSSNLLIRFSKYGKFYGCETFPKCKYTKPYLQFVEGKACPECKGRIVTRFTKRKKRFYGCENYPKCTFRAWKIQ